MTDLAASPVRPGERIVALDVIRGFAVLGILVMNVVEFGLPMAAYTDPSVAGGTTGADLWTWYVQSALFDGRMRALFSMLFGAGIVLIGERAARTASAGAADLLLRRCLWLIPFGIVHRFLLQWTGDILYIYGLLGVLAVAFRNLRPRTLLALGAAALLAFVPIELRRHSVAAGLRTDAAEAVRLEAAAEPVPAALASARTRWERRNAPHDPNANDAEIAAMRGSWLDVAALRWEHNHAFQHAYVYYYFVWDVLGMVLIGMALLRIGFFSGRLRTSVYGLAVAAGVAAAAVSLWLAREQAASNWSPSELSMRAWRDVLYPWLRGVGGLGWAALLVLALRTPVARLLTIPLGAVGRMAFSNYVLQTLLCTTFFFGWGLGRFATLSRAELMVVVAAASVVQIAFSVAWLRRFRFGPLEWVWRSLTYGRRQPMAPA
ncbi:MAG: DUF418 domain-containing protein [Planctomycetes bacterium]|nr:DUF418 domain-containing protein [Planctomycetota bacterium]